MRMGIRSTAVPDQKPQWGLAVLGLIALAVAGALAGYSQVHPGNGSALYRFGFSSMLAMKSWLTSAATALVVIQLVSALAMWGKLPGVRNVPAWVAGVHRWTGTVAFVVSLPVAFQCVWSLGFSSSSTRTLVHSILGCLFYGVFTAKMLALRMRRLPGWTLPVLGGLLAVVLTGIWFSAAFWYFTQPALPQPY